MVEPGQVGLDFSSPTPLPAGPLDFVILTAAVATPAERGRTHVLDVRDVIVNGGQMPAIVDDAVHKVAFFGDSTGDGTYSGLDAQRTARVVVGLDDGFDSHPDIDPLVIADVTGDGSISGLDAQRIAQFTVGMAPIEIPSLPQALKLDPAASQRHPVLETTAGGELSSTQLDTLVDSAWDLVESAVPGNVSAELRDLTVRIADLPNGLLGLVSGETITIDDNGAGFGWFVDATPGDNTEFVATNGTQHLTARPGTPAAGRVDLLTVIMHELGHFLGYDHKNEGLMDDTLPLGTRRLPENSIVLLHDPSDELDVLNRSNKQTAVNVTTIDKVFETLG